VVLISTANHPPVKTDAEHLSSIYPRGSQSRARPGTGHLDTVVAIDCIGHMHTYSGHGGAPVHSHILLANGQWPSSDVRVMMALEVAMFARLRASEGVCQ
jgi:hypothetical protein